ETKQNAPELNPEASCLSRQTKGARGLSSGSMTFEPFDETGLGRARTDLHVGGFATLEQDHGRDRAHAILGGGSRILIDVELDDLHLARHLARDFLEDRGNRPAG